LVSALVAGSATSRLKFVGQLTMNSLVFAVAISLLVSAGAQGVRSVTRVTLGVLTIAVALQVAIAPQLNNRGTSTLGIPRPVLAFFEEGWLGLYSALLLLACIGLRIWASAGLAFALVLLSDNRGALIIAVVALVLATPQVRDRNWIRWIPLLLVIAFAASFVVWVMSGAEVFLFRGDNTLLTRKSDFEATLSANPAGLFPWGGEQIDVYDAARARQLPATSNVLTVELVWKYGIGGLVIMGTYLAYFTVLAVPIRSVLRKKSREFAVFAGVASSLVLLNFNNALGRSWYWAELALVASTVWVSFGSPTAGDESPEHPVKAASSVR
jgi:hypothetical protein